MINGEKIGVGIITYNRPKLLKKCVESIPTLVDTIVVVNDGKSMDQLQFTEQIGRYDSHEWIETDGSIGVGKSKNIAFNFLINGYESNKCDHIFIIEDDIFIKDPMVFEKYIKASKASGIQHFNFSQHGMMNKTFDQFRTPNPRTTVNYGEESISLYPHCVGAFSYYSRKCLETVGLIDERYYNACEHVDHTYEMIEAGMHPPFWWFADIANSWEYLGDEEWSIAKSTISSNPKHQQMMQDADKIFVEKHGHLPGQTLDNSFEYVGQKLKQIKTKYGPNASNL
jgi:GT2 family glycosyltransferase